VEFNIGASMPSRRIETPFLPLPAGGALYGRVSREDSAAGDAILFVHGFGSTHYGEKARALEAACARRGWTFASFDLRGHGRSGGRLQEMRAGSLQEDLDRVWEYLGGQGMRRLFVVGSSMGGWAGGWFTRRHPEVVPAFASVAPAFDFLGRWYRMLSEEQLRDWERSGRLRIHNIWLDVEINYGLVEDRDSFAAEKLADGWSTPAVIFHGVEDDTVPYTESLDFLRRVEGTAVELRLYRRGDHRLTAFKEQIAEAICEFFAPWYTEPNRGLP
jgi:pimeloyl-ACP methyl ester carboxylesterase